MDKRIISYNINGMVVNKEELLKTLNIIFEKNIWDLQSNSMIDTITRAINHLKFSERICDYPKNIEIFEMFELARTIY